VKWFLAVGDGGTNRRGEGFKRPFRKIFRLFTVGELGGAEQREVFFEVIWVRLAIGETSPSGGVHGRNCRSLIPGEVDTEQACGGGHGKVQGNWGIQGFPSREELILEYCNVVAIVANPKANSIGICG